MKLETVDRIAAPVEAVFSAYSNYRRLENLAGVRDIEFTREGNPADGPLALAWQLRVPFRGRIWDTTVRVSRFIPPHEIVCTSGGKAFDGMLSLTFEPTEDGATLVHSTADVAGVSIAAKMLIATLVIARNEIERRFAIRMAGYAAMVERQLAAAAAD